MLEPMNCNKLVWQQINEILRDIDNQPHEQPATFWDEKQRAKLAADFATMDPSAVFTTEPSA